MIGSPLHRQLARSLGELRKRYASGLAITAQIENWGSALTFLTYRDMEGNGRWGQRGKTVFPPFITQIELHRGLVSEDRLRKFFLGC